MTRQQRSLAALALLCGCANAQYVEPEAGEPDELGELSGLEQGGSSAGHPSTTTAGSSAGGKPSSAGGGKGGAGGRASGGNASSGKGGGDDDDGGSSAGGKGGAAPGNGGASGSAGSAGSVNQPAMCDEASATVLGSMNANVTVASNVCLKMTVAADQTWVKKITMQPEAGQYPLPFSWSNCGTNSSGAFTANYGNQILTPINLQCPVLVKLGGNGTPVNVQWWGG